MAGAKRRNERAAERRVLVIEDDADLAKSVRRSLRVWGYEPLVSSSIAGARALVAGLGVPHGLAAALVDLRLPDGDGTSILPWLDALRPAVPAIILTGYYDADRALELCRRCVVVKPASAEQLRSIIDFASTLFADVYDLSEQEARVVDLAYEGASNQRIALELDDSVSSVASYWQRIFSKVSRRRDTSCRSKLDVVLLRADHDADRGILPAVTRPTYVREEFAEA